MKTLVTKAFCFVCFASTQTQLSNVWWMPNSGSKGFDTAMRTGSARRFKQHPTTYMWVSSLLPFTVDSDLSCFILILSKGKVTWHSRIGCGVSFDSSWWARFHSTVKTFAYWVWHSSLIGGLWFVSPDLCDWRCFFLLFSFFFNFS